MADRYWVGGTGTWNTTSTTNWSASSGGATGASVPTIADNVFFDQSATYTVTMTGALACLNITVSAGPVTFATGTTPTLTVAGSWSTVAGTVWSATGTVTFTATTSKTITSGGITISSPFTFNGAAGTWTLQDNLTFATTITTTLTQGTLALGSFTLTTGLFSSTNSNTRSINFGTGKIALKSATTSTIWTTATVTGLTVSGTSLVECSGGGTGVTKTINISSSVTIAQCINFSLLETTGTATYAFSSGAGIASLIVNGSQTISNTSLYLFNLTHLTTNGTTTFTAGANAWVFWNTSGSYTIGNISGFTYDFPWTIGYTLTASTSVMTLGANLTLGATRALTLVTGTFDFNSKTLSAVGFTINNTIGTATIANTGTGSLSLTVPITHTSGTLTLPFNLTTSSATGYTFTAGTLALSTFTLTTTIFSSSGTGTRTLNYGTGQLALTSNSATIFNVTTATNFTTSGTVYINATYTGSTGTRTLVTGFTEAQAASYNVSTSGTAGIVLSPSATDIVALTGSFNTVDLTGFTGTLSNTARTIYANLVMPASGGTFAAGTTATTFAGTGTETITTNGRTLDFPITFSGVGGTFRLQSALLQGSTRAFTHTNGTIDLNGYTLTVGTSYTTAAGTKNLTFNGGTLVCPTASATTFNNAVPAGFTTTAGTGTGTISLTAATAKTFVGGSVVYNCDIDNTGAGALTVTGINTFNRIKSSYADTTANTSILLPAGNTTITVGITGGSSLTKLLDLGTAANTRANVVIADAGIQTASFLSTNSIVFIANTLPTDGTGPWKWYLANSINNGDTLGAVFQEYSNSAPIVYYITSGASFTVPANWDNSNNAIHIYGAGGGSSGSYVVSASGNRLGSAGGGGGGYTQVLNLTATPGSSLSYSIGSGGAAGAANNLSSGGNGGITTFASIYSANGGTGSSITNSTTTAGVGGTGATANGGAGGIGGGAAGQANNSSGGGGGGSGGPNGVGRTGGNGTIADSPSVTAGGGGGGSGGGTNGANAVGATPGTGGNNFIGTRAGGNGGVTTANGATFGTERGRASYDILNSTGGAGGGGGGGAYGPSVGDPLNIGGGAGGSGATDADFVQAGTAGQSGGIIILYYPTTIVISTSNMFMMFQ